MLLHIVDVSGTTNEKVHAAALCVFIFFPPPSGRIVLGVWVICIGFKKSHKGGTDPFL